MKNALNILQNILQAGKEYIHFKGNYKEKERYSLGGKSVYSHSLPNKGIIRIGDLISEDNELITKQRLRELNISPLDAFKLCVIEALPDEWRNSLSTRNFTAIESFNLKNECQLNVKRAKRPNKRRCLEDSL